MTDMQKRNMTNLARKSLGFVKFFPWDDKYDIDQGCDSNHPKAWHLAEIVYSPEYCIDAMIRHFTAYTNKQ